MSGQTALTLAFVVACSTPALAGSLSCGGKPCDDGFTAAAYAGSKCQSPETPKIKTSDSDALKESQQRAQAYLDQEKVYFACIKDEANSDLDAITKVMTDSVQSRQAAEEKKFSAVQQALNVAAERNDRRQADAPNRFGSQNGGPRQSPTPGVTMGAGSDR